MTLATFWSVRDHCSPGLASQPGAALRQGRVHIDERHDGERERRVPAAADALTPAIADAAEAQQGAAAPPPPRRPKIHASEPGPETESSIPS